MNRNMEKIPSKIMAEYAQTADPPIYYIQPVQIRSGLSYLVGKRLFDLVFACIGIVIFLIPMGVISVCIKLNSPGPFLFCQERLGKNGKPFLMYKFRSMYMDAENTGPRWAAENDGRVTSVGKVIRKFRLDELPQLFNILKGEMSFVGPRPERAFFYREFSSYIKGFEQRLKVVPGLTGLAQVCGGYDLKPEEKIVYDIFYMENRSFFYDLWIIAKTLGTVFNHQGAR